MNDSKILYKEALNVIRGLYLALDPLDDLVNAAYLSVTAQHLLIARVRRITSELDVEIAQLRTAISTSI